MCIHKHISIYIQLYTYVYTQEKGFLRLTNMKTFNSTRGLLNDFSADRTTQQTDHLIFINFSITGSHSLCLRPDLTIILHSNNFCFLFSPSVSVYLQYFLQQVLFDTYIYHKHRKLCIIFYVIIN